MAEVYVAKTKGIGGFEKLVAIKVIHPRYSEDEHFIQMLVEEAKISVQLSHVNIAQTFDLGCIDDTYYIAMEYIEGADTYRVGKRALDKKKPLPIDICCYVGAEICHGLGYAHRKRDADGQPMGIVHRDVSPQNVLISYAGEVKLVDFGIAKAALRTGQTEVGVIKGKYYYMSPEQAWGDPVDQRSDVFSTGLLLHELLTGEMVYQENNVPALLDQVRKAEIEGPRAKREDVPAELDRVVLRALAKEPADRYQSAHALAQDLTEILYRRSPAFTAAKLAELMGELFPDAIKRSAELTSQITRVPTDEPTEDLPPSTSVEHALESMARDEFTPSAESSVIFDLDDVDDRTRNDIIPFRRTGSGADAERQTRRLDAAEVEREQGDTSTATSTAPMSRGDEWDEETFLKDRSPWDESTLIDDDGQAMADVHRLIESARRPKDAESGEIEGEATVASASPFMPPRKPGSLPSKPSGVPQRRPVPPPPGRGVVKAKKPASIPPPPARLPPRPQARSRLGGRAGAAAAAAEDTESTLDLEPVELDGEATQAGPEPTELPAEKTAALAEIGEGRSSRPFPEAGPSAGGIRLGPQADRFFSTPNAATQQVTPASDAGAPAPLESPAEPPPAFASPPEADPFVAAPPMTGPQPVQLGKPQPLRWVLLGGIVSVALFVLIGLVAWALSGPDPSSLEILSVPEGAEVTLNGAPLEGVTPVHVEELETGSTAHVEITLDGYEPREEDIAIVEGENRRLIVLNPVQVSLHIESVPSGAQIWVDDVHRGNSPLDISLTAGQTVELRARVPGRPQITRRVRADPGETRQTETLTFPPPSD